MRIITVGSHSIPTLEIDVTPEQQRQLDSAWNIATVFSSPYAIEGPTAKRYSEMVRQVLGFDWECEFARLCPNRSPQMTTRVLSSSVSNPKE